MDLIERRHRTTGLGVLAVLGLLAASCGSAVTSTDGPTTSAPSSTSTSTAPAPPSTTPTTAPPVTPIPAGAHLTTLDVAFFNATVGYGLFAARTQSACGIAVAYTVDGGAHFKPPVAVSSCSRFSNARRSVTSASIAFDDHGDGFVYGTGLFVTHDGGVTWQAEAQPGPVLSVEALGSSIWMLEDRCPTPTCTARLLESTDGGTTWHPTPVRPAMTNHSPQLVRVSTEAAYVLTAPVYERPGTGVAVPLWYTSDGGRSWAQRSVPCAGLGVTLSAAPTGRLFAACAGEPGAGNQAKGVHVPKDGGASWSTPEVCASTDVSGTCKGLTAGYLGTLVAVSAATAYLAGPRSPVRKTTDGGATWKVVLTSRTIPTKSSALTFFNSTDGLVVGEAGGVSTLFHTSDGGKHWTPVGLPTTVPQLVG